MPKVRSRYCPHMIENTCTRVYRFRCILHHKNLWTGLSNFPYERSPLPYKAVKESLKVKKVLSPLDPHYRVGPDIWGLQNREKGPKYFSKKGHFGLKTGLQKQDLKEFFNVGSPSLLLRTDDRSPCDVCDVMMSPKQGSKGQKGYPAPPCHYNVHVFAGREWEIILRLLC